MNILNQKNPNMINFTKNGKHKYTVSTDPDIIKLIEEHIEQYKNEGKEMLVKLLDTEELYGDVIDAAKDKRHRMSVKIAIGDPVRSYTDTITDPENRLHQTIRFIQYSVITDNFVPPEHQPIEIQDGPKGKIRQIIRPQFHIEQIIHHSLVRVLEPIFMKKMYYYSAASIPKRGTHFLRKHIEHAIKFDSQNTKYCLKMDIRKFFQSIPHRKLKTMLKEDVRDDTVRKLLFKVIDSVEEGLPLGFYTSQWLANYYLQPIDHYIKERMYDDLKISHSKKRHGAPHYFRYMDDMVLFGPNKKELHRARLILMDKLKKEYGLSIKDDWNVFRFDYIDDDGVRKGNMLDFIGFRFYHDKVTIREKIYERIIKLIDRLIVKNKQDITFHEVASMLSYYGYVVWSDSKGIYYNMLKPYIGLKDLKRIVSEENSKYNKYINTIMDRDEWIKGYEPEPNPFS